MKQIRLMDEGGRRPLIARLWRPLRLKMRVLVPLVVILLVGSPTLGNDWPSAEVLRACQTALSSKAAANSVGRWLTTALPSEYRKAAGPALGDSNVLGWTAHTNSNRTSTVVIKASDAETEEVHFVVLMRDKDGVTFKASVFAFEVALSTEERQGVAGLFFCGKSGPSSEWNWDGNNWK